MAKNISTDSNPIKTDAANQGDVISQLANAQTPGAPGLNDNANVGAAATEPSTVSQDATAQLEGEIPSMADKDSGAVKRLQQQLATTNSLLIGLGIDPESEIASEYKAGRVTRQQLLEHIGIVPPAQQQQAQPLTKDPISKLKTLREKVRKEGATQEDFQSLVDSVSDIVDENIQYRNQMDANNLVANCIGAVDSVLVKDETHITLPDEIKDIERQIFLSSTDNLIAQEAQKTGRPQAYLNPQTYERFAKTNLERINKWRTYWMDKGKTPQTRIGQRTMTSPPVNPITTNAGAGPVIPQRPRITIDNLDAAVKNYVASQAAPV